MIDWLQQSWHTWRKPKTLGQRGEDAAARFLKRLGYTILVRSDRSILGELDIVAVDGETIVFVEVKTRVSDSAGLPAEAVDDAKQQKLTRLALAYLKRNDLLEYSARFDVIGILWPDSSKKPEITHYINAFEATGQFQMHS
ncbi:MAG: YraN family protein [Blastopirellula sp.]|nr:MAG: YraN family protein [Blastopirellula sp.]